MKEIKPKYALILTPKRFLSKLSIIRQGKKFARYLRNSSYVSLKVSANIKIWL
jgi:hypothetical protein